MRDQGNFQTFERIAKKSWKLMYCRVKGPKFGPFGIKKGPKYPLSTKKVQNFGLIRA